MKHYIKTALNLKQDIEKPVYMLVTFHDDTEQYGQYHLIVTVDRLKEMVKMRIDSGANYMSNYWEYYNRMMLARFKPKVSIYEFCEVTMEYVSYQICNQKNKRKYFSQGNLIVSNIHVEKESKSSLQILRPEHVNNFKGMQGCHKYVGKEFPMITFDTKINFITYEEFMFLLGIVKVVKSSVEPVCRFTDNEFYDLWLEQNKDSDICRERDTDDIIGILNKLFFYDFIDIQYKGDGEEIPYSQEITVYDLETIASCYSGIINSF
jgi:hypothetical protein